MLFRLLGLAEVDLIVAVPKVCDEFLVEKGGSVGVKPQRNQVHQGVFFQEVR